MTWVDRNAASCAASRLSAVAAGNVVVFSMLAVRRQAPGLGWSIANVMRPATAAWLRTIRPQMRPSLALIGSSVRLAG